MNLSDIQISAIIITFNEEKNIEICLKSIEWINEIIIIDSYSTDQTVNIAERYTKRIFYNKFKNNFFQQRNFALERISKKSQWIIILDADESLSTNSQKIIKKNIIDDKSKAIDGYWLPRRNYISQNNYLHYGLFYPDYQLRIFRNNIGIKYNGAIHEEPIISKIRTREICAPEIIHNCSNTKYDKFASIIRFLPYIKIEGKEVALTKKSSFKILIEGFWNFFGYFFSSFIRGKGYKDGYFGFRAALIFSLYRAMVSVYAIKYRL